MESDCIEWTKSRNKNGYGRRKFRGQSMGAHRAAWIETNGAIPGDLVVRHKCDNRACVNIEHLELGTQAENMMDYSVSETTISRIRNHNRWK